MDKNLSVSANALPQPGLVERSETERFFTEYRSNTKPPFGAATP